MSIEKLFEMTVGDTVVTYYHNPESGQTEMAIAPVNAKVPRFDRTLQGNDWLNPLTEVKIRGDHGTCGFGAGRTMRLNGSTDLFRYRDMVEGDHEIVTTLADPRGNELRHHLSWRGEVPVFTVFAEFRNGTSSPLTLDMIESFALGGLTPYTDGEPHERLKLHRFRSYWSSEARQVCDTAEDLGLERSWGDGHAMESERFGQVGTMPTRGYHPFAAVEDAGAGVFWGVQLAWAGSWQIEFSRRRALTLCLSGGLADREFGHWSKQLQPGESFRTPEAFVACVAGDLDMLCNRLLAEQEARLDLPESEQDLPIIFNEWCTTWGDPREEKVLAIADKIKDTPIRYLVIDAGWFKTEGTEWHTAQGDWEPNREMFPDGMGKTADRIRERGLIPGVWFEFEVCGPQGRAFYEHEKNHLTLDGIPICSNRRFWNLCDPEAVAYLEEKVVQMLKRNRFGYIKVDYNETIGLGCDHPDSPGEGLRNHVLGVYRIFKRMREVNPELVIENCSSGGHRLEPSMFALTSMSSFSDAHEEPEEPVIAASLHRLMLPCQNQIWAVVKPSHNLRQIGYILASGMLGRLCLSGDVLNLSKEQWDFTCEGLEFYRKLVPILKDGYSCFYPMSAPARRRLRGSQLLMRYGKDGRIALFLHGFNEVPGEMACRLPAGDWEIEAEFAAPNTGTSHIGNGEYVLSNPAPMSGRVVILRRK